MSQPHANNNKYLVLQKKKIIFDKVVEKIRFLLGFTGLIL